MIVCGVVIVWCVNLLCFVVWNEFGGDLVGVDGVLWYEIWLLKIMEWIGVLDWIVCGNFVFIVDGIDGMIF